MFQTETRNARLKYVSETQNATLKRNSAKRGVGRRGRSGARMVAGPKAQLRRKTHKNTKHAAPPRGATKTAIKQQINNQ